MMIRTASGRRVIAPGDVAHVMPHQQEGDHAYVTIVLDSGEHVTGMACVDDIEHLLMIRHSLDHPPLVA